MTPEEITAMAREAGIEFEMQQALSGEHLLFTDGSVSIGRMQRLVALVAEKAAAKEREACADLCDQFAARTTEAQQGPSDALSNVMLRQIAVLGFGEAAYAIRARGTKEGV